MKLVLLALAAGVPRDDIGLVANSTDGRLDTRPGDAGGASTGTAPGLTSTAPDRDRPAGDADGGGGTGATVGAVLGGGAGLLAGRGGTLLVVRADESVAATVQSILDGRTAVDTQARRADGRRFGWTGFNGTLLASTADQVQTDPAPRAGAV